MSLSFIVETCTVHGPTRQRRWHRVHSGSTKADCNAYIDKVIADLPSNQPRSFGLTQERARGFYRVRAVRGAK